MICRIIFLAMLGCLLGVAEEGAVEKRHFAGTIVAFGDSLTKGHGVEEEEAYPALLEKKLTAAGYHWRVVNAGSNGETSSRALSRVDEVLGLKPKIVILETGANDGFRRVEPEVTQKNIEEIVRTLEKKKVTVVLAGMRMVSSLEPEFVRQFNAIYPAVAGKYRLIFMPFFLEGVAGRPALNQRDALHPLPAGYRIITDRIYPYVVQAIEKRSLGD